MLFKKTSPLDTCSECKTEPEKIGSKDIGGPLAKHSPTERHSSDSDGVRTCKQCSVEKPLSEFHSHITAGKKYWVHTCKECVKPAARARKKAWYDKDPERARRDSTRWYSDNKECALQAVADYRKKRAEWWKEYHKKWRGENPGKILAWVRKYQAAKLQAIPVWADFDAILGIYERAQSMKDSGIPCEVDHIVPLRSKLVCGLHVASNLQIIDPMTNKKKGNRWWPDMP